jgi:hypothetical protein
MSLELMSSPYGSEKEMLNSRIDIYRRLSFDVGGCFGDVLQQSLGLLGLLQRNMFETYRLLMLKERVCC